jgi:hypothetical protein
MAEKQKLRNVLTLETLNPTLFYYFFSVSGLSITTIERRIATTSMVSIVLLFIWVLGMLFSITANNNRECKTIPTHLIAMKLTTEQIDYVFDYVSLS